MERTQMSLKPVKKVKSQKSFHDKIRPYLYLSPSLVSIFILSFLPIMYTVYVAFTNYSINHINDYSFVGLKNFKDILSGPLKSIFFPVFGWTFIFALITVFGSFIIGLIIALVLNNPNMKESGIYKGILIIPWALPGTIAVLSWQGLLNPTYGGVNVTLKALHLITNNIPWLTDPFWARLGIIIVSLWLGFPYMMNVCIGALSSIPNTYYEAADIEGASRWVKFTKITLPSITSSAIPLLISSFAFHFNDFGAAFLITGGGPARMDSAFAGYTDILVSTTYKMAMQQNRYDLGSALSIIIFIVIGTISFLNMKASGAFEEVE